MLGICRFGIVHWIWILFSTLLHYVHLLTHITGQFINTTFCVFENDLHWGSHNLQNAMRFSDSHHILHFLDNTEFHQPMNNLSCLGLLDKSLNTLKIVIFTTENSCLYIYTYLLFTLLVAVNIHYFINLHIHGIVPIQAVTI